MNKPKHFFIFKIIGAIGLIVALIGIILTVKGFGNFENNNFIIGGLLATFGFFIGALFLVQGFKPEIARMNAKAVKYVQEQNKAELTDIANNAAEIMSNAVSQTANAVKDGVSENTEGKIYCKHCCALIDADSKFCNKCGKEQ